MIQGRSCVQDDTSEAITIKIKEDVSVEINSQNTKRLLHTVVCTRCSKIYFIVLKL